MRVNIDNTGRQCETVRIDYLAPTTNIVANFTNASAVNGNGAVLRRIAQPIDDAGVANDKIVHMCAYLVTVPDDILGAY